MLLARDLGLLWSAVVVVVVGGWFAVRQKWRRAVARKEEIRKLIALAAEEAARAELESAAGYSYGSVLSTEPVVEDSVVGSGSSPGRQLQYQCEVCFSPTTTRCKQCKAVRYCSGKCQIIHWRQGHKDECLSFASQRNSNEGFNSPAKEFMKNATQRNCDGTGIKTKHPTETLESPSGEVFPNLTFHIPSGKKVTEVGSNGDGVGVDINLEAWVQSLPDECSSSSSSSGTPVSSDSKFKDSNVESVQPFSSEKQPILTNQLKSGSLGTDEQSVSSISSDSLAAGSREPSGPSSRFWEGTVEPIRGKVDAPDEACDANMSFSRSFGFPSPHRVEEVNLGASTNSAKAYVPLAATSISKRSADAAVEVNEDGLKSREPISSNHKLASDPTVGYAQRRSKMEEAKLLTSTFFEEHVNSISEGNVCNKDLVGGRKLQSLAPKQADNRIDGTSGTPSKVKRVKDDCAEAKASESHLSSPTCSKKPTTMDVKSPRVCGANFSTRRVVDQLSVSSFLRHGSFGTGSGIMGKYEGSFPYELFVKLYHWNKVELRPCGLMNCGNSCYANAVIQCLAFTPPLTAYFLEGIHSKACERKAWCFTCEFEMLVKKIKDSNSPQSPAPILSQMHRIGGNLGNGREEDAHEFLRYAVEAMQSVCLKEAGVNVPKSLNEETTLVGLTFGGYLRSKIECMRCGGISEQHERIMDLTVEIGGDIGSLEEALRQFTRSEILDGENKYHCSRCKSYVRAKKKLRVLEAPNILTIALKRFQSGKFGKLNKAVKFPEILNLAPYMSGTSDKSPIYRLYGVVVHLDVMNAAFSGHYVCYVKNNQGRWFQADDTMVQNVELEKVLSKGAYMLLYARCSPRAPRLIRSSTAAYREAKKPKNPNCNSNLNSTEPWHVSACELNGDTACIDCFYLRRSGIHLEEDSSSENSNSSSLFSESGSHNSTDSSNRESSMSTDDNFEQVLGDINCWYNSRPWRNSSDSDTSSPSSSPSPLHARQSPLADLDRYSSDAETSGSYDVDGDGFWARSSSKVKASESREKGSYLCPDASTKLGGSSSLRGNGSISLGRNNARDSAKDVHFRMVTGRADYSLL